MKLEEYKQALDGRKDPQLRSARKWDNHKEMNSADHETEQGKGPSPRACRKEWSPANTMGILVGLMTYGAIGNKSVLF